MIKKKKILFFGFGYTAQALFRRLDRQKWKIFGTYFSQKERKRMPGGTLLKFSRSTLVSNKYFKNLTHILISIPPDKLGDPTLQKHFLDLAHSKTLQWVGYLSSTSVYGNWNGKWVDESFPLRPIEMRARRRLNAEKKWMKVYNDYEIPVHIFRLAGIYGPGRNVLESIKRNKARIIIKKGQFFSRIHVLDIAKVLLASIKKPNPGSIYNVCDDLPSPPQDVVVYGYRLLKKELPSPIKFKDAALSSLGKSFYKDNKRVRNKKIKKELRIDLTYKNYKIGLNAIHRSIN